MRMFGAKMRTYIKGRVVGVGMAKKTRERILVVVCAKHERILKMGIVARKAVEAYPVKVCNVIGCGEFVCRAGQIEVEG